MQTQAILAYEINFLCLFVVKQILSVRRSIFPVFIFDAARQIWCHQKHQNHLPVRAQSIKQMEQMWRIAGVFHDITSRWRVIISYFWANYVCSEKNIFFLHSHQMDFPHGENFVGKHWENCEHQKWPIWCARSPVNHQNRIMNACDALKLLFIYFVFVSAGLIADTYNANHTLPTMHAFIHCHFGDGRCSKWWSKWEN